MGKPDVDSLLNHFAHEHPLELINSQTQATSTNTNTNTYTCSACKGKISGFLYACLSCNYFLHKPCFSLPRTLKHKADEAHNLVLLSSPAYPQGAFKCNACGSHGNGFSYHCPDCHIDLHTVCAFMPQSIDHISHDHPLTICFSPPYETNAFKCDICRGPGSNHWLYRCGLCEFDAHLKCAKAQTSPQAVLVTTRSLPSHPSTARPSSQHPPPILPAPPPVSLQQQFPLQPPPLPSAPPPVSQQQAGTPYIQTYHSFPGAGTSVPHYQPQVYHQQVGPSSAVPQYVQPPRENSLINNLAGHAIDGFTGAIVEQLVQGVLQEMQNS